jgi:hypothetical protein
VANVSRLFFHHDILSVYVLRKYVTRTENGGERAEEEGGRKGKREGEEKKEGGEERFLFQDSDRRTVPVVE